MLRSESLKLALFLYPLPFWLDLRRVAVQDAEALLTLVEEGTRRRRTASTRRNSTSSRSHALLEITTPHATLHLADLAGR